MLEKLIIIIVFGGIALYEIPKLIKGKSWRELGVVSTIILLGLSISLLNSFGVEIPMPKLP